MNPSRTFHWTLWALWDQCWEMTGLRSSRLSSDKWWAPEHLSLPSAGRGERKCSRTYFIKKLSSITTTHPLCVYPSDDRRLKTAHSCWLTPQARHDWLDPTRHPTLTFPSDVQRTLYCTLSVHTSSYHCQASQSDSHGALSLRQSSRGSCHDIYRLSPWEDECQVWRGRERYLTVRCQVLRGRER